MVKNRQSQNARAKNFPISFTLGKEATVTEHFILRHHQNAAGATLHRSITEWMSPADRAWWQASSRVRLLRVHVKPIANPANTSGTNIIAFNRSGRVYADEDNALGAEKRVERPLFAQAPFVANLGNGVEMHPDTLMPTLGNIFVANRSEEQLNFTGFLRAVVY